MSFVESIFDYSEGDVNKGARRMKELGIKQTDIDALTPEEVDRAFAYYKQQHKDHGIPYINERGIFENSLRHNLERALGMAPYV